MFKNKTFYYIIGIIISLGLFGIGLVSKNFLIFMFGLTIFGASSGMIINYYSNKND